MKISSLLKPEAIAIGAAASSKDDAISKLVDLMATEGNVADRDAYEAAVHAREDEGTTALGEGIAIPHAKTAAVTAPGLAAMTLPAGVDYDAPDGQPTTLMFLIAAPDTKADVHLEVLSRLSTLLMDPAFCASLRAAATSEEFLAAIDAAISMMDADAIVLIAIYPGHAEGELEGRLVGEKLSKLDRHYYTVACFRMMNSPTSPYFYIVEGR